jgi:Protein of unknown function (DUF3800)
MQMAVDQFLEIFCDEAGHTGSLLLDQAQLYFAFSSIAISDAEAMEIITSARSRFPVQMPELKASKLLRSTRGMLLICEVLGRIKGKYAVVVHDKVMALCAHFFEYIYEPVFSNSPWLLYSKKLHVSVAMILYAWFRVREGDAEQLLIEFQHYLRSLDPAKAPSLFGKGAHSQISDGDPLDWVLRFARACQREIEADNESIRRELPEEGKWLGDLATTSLWAHLNFWGSRGIPIALTCDISKPLIANVDNLTGDESDPGILRARRKSYTGSLGWRLKRPVEFGDSKDHPALELADVIAGAAAFAIRRDIAKTGDIAKLRGALHEHVLPQCILPDFAMFDPNNKQAAVNTSILYRLAQKAERGLDLRVGLEEDYLVAEQAWESRRLA